jgi:hypothetical protein
MRVRLLKRWGNSVKSFPMGSVIRVQDPLGKRLIENKTGEMFHGKLYPKKMKTNFFKPK